MPSKSEGRPIANQLERAKTVKVGKFKWPPDKVEDAPSSNIGLSPAQNAKTGLNDVGYGLLTIERTQFPNSQSQSQFMTAAKIAAAQQELMLKIAPGSHAARNSDSNAHQELRLTIAPGSQAAKSGMHEPGREQELFLKTTLESQGSKNNLYESKAKTSEIQLPLRQLQVSALTDDSKTQAKELNSSIDNTPRGMNILQCHHFPYTSYLQVPWKLCIRKEVFGHEQNLKLTVNMIFHQILKDCTGPRNIKLRPKDQRNILTLLSKMGDLKLIQDKRKAEVVDFVRENCPYYFMRVFPLITNESSIEFVGVSQKQIVLGRTSIATDKEPNLEAVYEFPHHNIDDVSSEKDLLTVTVKNLIHPFVFQTRYAESISILSKKLSSEMKSESKLPPSKIPGSRISTSRIPTTKIPASKIPVSKIPVSKIAASISPSSKIQSSKVPTSKVPVSDINASYDSALNIPASNTAEPKAVGPKIPESKIPIIKRKNVSRRQGTQYANTKISTQLQTSISTKSCEAYTEGYNFNTADTEDYHLDAGHSENSSTPNHTFADKDLIKKDKFEVHMGCAYFLEPLFVCFLVYRFYLIYKHNDMTN